MDLLKITLILICVLPISIYLSVKLGTAAYHNVKDKRDKQKDAKSKITRT